MNLGQVQSSIPKDQNDQGPRHPGHMGGDTLGCRVGCSGVQIYIMIKSKIQNQYGMDALDVITEYLFAEVSWQSYQVVDCAHDCHVLSGNVALLFM